MVCFDSTKKHTKTYLIFISAAGDRNKESTLIGEWAPLSSAMKRMSASKACGVDGVTIGMLRVTFPVIGPHLLNVINSSLVSGKLPAEWKVARVIPLHKSGSVDDPSNYRPLSLLSLS